MRRETLSIADSQSIILNPNNPNSMDSTEFASLCALMATSDTLIQPIVLYDNGDELEMVDGHHRLKAAKAIGLSEVEAMVIEQGDMVEEYRHHLAVGLNKIRGKLQLSALGDLFADMLEEGMAVQDIALTGFSQDEISDLIQATAEIPLDSTDGALEGAELPPVDGVSDTTAPPKPFLIEIEFTSKSQYKQATKALKRAAGKQGTLAEGLMLLIGAQEE